MGLDIKEKISEITDKIKGNPDLMSNFKKDPVKTVEGVIGVDLPDDTVKKIADGVSAKISADKLSSAAEKLGGLFKK